MLKSPQEPTFISTASIIRKCSEDENDSSDETSKHMQITDPLKLRLYSMCKFLMDYETEDGRKPMMQFMDESSRKYYPDHYEMDDEPTDMLVIENNIRANKYSSENELIRDMRQMFHKCRESTEEESPIYRDALILEEVLMNHASESGMIVEEERPTIVNFIKVELPDIKSEIPQVKTEIVDIPDVKMEVSHLAGIRMKVSNVMMEDPIAISPSIPKITVTSSTSSMKKMVSKLCVPSTGTHRYKKVSGYILYSCDARKIVRANNPLATFGEVSAIVGSEWKKLSAREKNEWEVKAASVNKESIERFLQMESTKSSPTALNVPQPNTGAPTVRVWACLWDNCNCMFEDLFDCLDHALANQTGHVSSWYTHNKMNEKYQCQWKDCIRVKRAMVPFPNLHRLIRHVREVHILKNMGLRRQQNS